MQILQIARACRHLDSPTTASYLDKRWKTPF